MEDDLLRLCSSKEFNEEGFAALLASERKSLEIDTCDEHGMTALMHSAYNGYVFACEKLISVGADVNANTHKDGYSTLMFAAIAGRCEVVALLLRAGARPSTTNNMRKTAANMAAFVGQHECAQIINNYLTFGEVHEYSGGGATLPTSVATPLHSILISTNIHPVKLLLRMESHQCLVQEASLVCRSLQAISLRLINDQREGLALKAHYVAFLLDLMNKHGSGSIMKRLLTCTEAGEWVEMDQLLRQCLREYPHVHTTLLQQMVATLAKTAPGRSPTAYSIFVSAIIGDKGAEAVAESCCVCGSLNTLKRCSKCKKVTYCSVNCQKLAWTKGNHKTLCKRWASTATPTT